MNTRTDTDTFLCSLNEIKVENSTNATELKKECPICKCDQIFIPRYPNAVCNECCSKAIDEFGNSVKYRNIDECGGFESIHMICGKNVKKDDHICWIDGKKCYSTEARFGGIVTSIIQ